MNFAERPTRRPHEREQDYPRRRRSPLTLSLCGFGTNKGQAIAQVESVNFRLCLRAYFDTPFFLSHRLLYPADFEKATVPLPLEDTVNGGKQAPNPDVALAGSLNPRKNADTVLRSSHFPLIHSQVMGKFMPKGFMDNLRDIALGRDRVLYWSLEERNRVRQTHAVAKAPVRQRNSMVEPEEGVPGRNIGGLQLGWAGLVLNEDCKIGETVAKGFRDGLPGLVHELFESSATHKVMAYPVAPL